MKQRGWRRSAKRLLDITVSTAAIGATAPVMLGTAAAIYATMGRPVLFRQPRVGEGERVFSILKFRTMQNAPPDISPDQDQARITPLGQLLRDTSLDELPQLFNILRGDMSLVGPRPLILRYLPRYSPQQRRRHEVLPGLTGLAQIRGRNTLSWEKKFAYDVQYVDEWSLSLDLAILARTALFVVRRDGVSAAGHATMPEFMGAQAT